MSLSAEPLAIYGAHTLAIYGALGLGLTILLYRVVIIFSRNINVEMATLQLVKLVSAGNIERAIKLCQVAERSIYLGSARDGLKAALSAGESASTRAQQAERSFDAAYKARLARHRNAPVQLVFAGILILGAALAGVILGRGLEPPLLGAAGVGAIMLFTAGKFESQIRSRLRPAFQQVVAALRKSS